ncbi:MAG: hypothetical protein JW951_02200 [Lentisphaerae bacterium]|nr:hypothetical protein [Lentisphaerota bacterium]
MKRAWLLGLLLLPVCGRADLLLKLTMEHHVYLQFEPMVGYLTLWNESDYPVVIDADDPERANTALRLIVTRDGRPVMRLNDRPLLRRLLLLPGERHVMMTDLSARFDVGTASRYLIDAEAVRDGVAYGAKPFMVDVVPGIEITSVKRGVPGYPGRERAYSLRYWTREKQEQLFLRIDEPSSGDNYGVFQLGRLLRFYKPRLRVDRDGFVTVIHQTAYNRYVRTVFEATPNEVRFLDQETIETETRPPEPPAGRERDEN